MPGTPWIIEFDTSPIQWYFSFEISKLIVLRVDISNKG